MGDKLHWENVFQSKATNEVSWFQDYPKTSMEYILKQNLPSTAAIIDIGGGDSNLADSLLEKGFTNISVLDISEAALERSKMRLGDKAKIINWIVADITDFKTELKFDFWHDRAVFHFLVTEDERSRYINTVTNGVKANGYFFLGTFSESGPLKCSGLPVTRYSEESMKETFKDSFDAINCFAEKHRTPFGTEQDFQFCAFKRKA